MFKTFGLLLLSGDYKCRVDFQTAPTQISPVELVVIIPPEKPRIFDETNAEVCPYLAHEYFYALN
jgi:hypothetical protein